MSLMGTFPVNEAGPGQMCLPESVIKDEGTNTQQPARELHIVCRRLQHLTLYRKVGACHLHPQNAYYQDRWHIEGTHSFLTTADCQLSPDTPNSLVYRVSMKRQEGDRCYRQCREASHSLQKTGILWLLFPRFRRDHGSAFLSHIPSYTHKGCRTRGNILFNYRYSNN